MDNIIECPKCNARENGCSFCDQTGYVYSEGGDYYTVTLDASNKPIKGKRILIQDNLKVGKSFFSFLFPQGEPHDMIWFFKHRNT